MVEEAHLREETHCIDNGNDAYSSGDTMLGGVVDLDGELENTDLSDPAMVPVLRCGFGACSSDESQRERRDPGGRCLSGGCMLVQMPCRWVGATQACRLE